MEAIRKWWRFRRAVRAAAEAALPPAGERDVLLMPCWRRPEFLWHCLDNLTRAEDFAGLHVIFRPDTGYSAETLEVIRDFEARLPSFEIQAPPPCPYRRTKQSANLLLGYLDAARRAHRWVFMVEEDVMVASDFFRWHRAVHGAAGALFCSIAVSNPHGVRSESKDPESYTLSHGDYCPYGVCFDRQVLWRAVRPHVNLAYMRQPKKYVRRHFADSKVGLGFVEQDGLLRRIQESWPLPIAYPCLPRAFDAGFYGYNRPGGLSGPLPERVAALGRIIYSAEEMRRAASRPEFVGAPVDLRSPDWQAQRQQPKCPVASPRPA